MRIERAEVGTRLTITSEDRQYTGIARHPLARQWMLKRLIEAREAAAAAETEAAEMRWSAEVDRLAGEARRCGIKLGGEV